MPKSLIWRRGAGQARGAGARGLRKVANSAGAEGIGGRGRTRAWGARMGQNDGFLAVFCSLGSLQATHLAPSLRAVNETSNQRSGWYVGVPGRSSRPPTVPRARCAPRGVAVRGLNTSQEPKFAFFKYELLSLGAPGTLNCSDHASRPCGSPKLWPRASQATSTAARNPSAPAWWPRFPRSRRLCPWRCPRACSARWP